MKTVDQIKKEITEVIKEMKSVSENFDFNEKQRGRETKKLSRKLEILKECKMYLETNPRQEFVNEEKERLTRIIALYESSERFDSWKRSILVTLKTTPKNIRAYYLKEMGVPDLKQSLKTIEYILSI